jgi:steroid delta-isomerase-like uncharacterized protein
MDRQQMDALIEQHIEAEMAGDPAGAVAMYTDDVEHDVVGSPSGPNHGRAAARGFYEQLVADFQTEEMAPTRQLYADDFCVIEHLCTGRATGEFLGIPGGDRRVSFRMLHVWEFKDGAISRENVWLDGGAIVAQLTADG